MIFNPRRGGSEKEYTITGRNDITSNVTKQKPGRVFRATSSLSGRIPKMIFNDPDTGKQVVINGVGRSSDFVMPCADVTLSYY